MRIGGASGESARAAAADPGERLQSGDADASEPGCGNAAGSAGADLRPDATDFVAVQAS